MATIAEINGLISKTPTQPLMRVVCATRGMAGISYNQYSNGGTDVSFTSRMKYTINNQCTGLQALFANFNMESPLTGVTNITLTAGWDDGTNIYQIFFNGNSSTTIVPGGFAFCDPLSRVWNKGDIIWLRVCVTVTSGGKWPKNQYTNAAISGEGNVSGDQTLAAISTFSTASQTFVYGALALFGTPTKKVPFIGLIGDSITRDGQGTATINQSWVVQALGTNYGQNYPYILTAQSGETAQTFATATGSQRRSLFLNGCTSIYCGYGINDVNQSRTLAQLQADIITIWRRYSDMGMYVFQGTLTPLTTSTDGFITTANQTVSSTAKETVRLGYNSWLRDGAPITISTQVAAAVGATGATVYRMGATGHPLSNIVDAGAGVDDGNGKWIVVSGHATTPDGTHPDATYGYPPMIAKFDLTILK